MKKTLFFLLGALLVTMMPGKAQAQNYQVKWSGANANVVYNALPVTGVRAVYADGNNMTIEANLSYINEAGEVLTSAIDAGVYQVIASPVTDDVTLTNNVTTLTITRRLVTVRGITPANVETFKWYDGNDSAILISNNGNRTGRVLPSTSLNDPNGCGTLYDMMSAGDNTVLQRANLNLTTYALFNDATEERRKSIVAYFVISDSDNFALDTNAMLLSTSGVILNHITINEGIGDNGFVINHDGYCNNVDINYEVLYGLPTQYRLNFSSDALNAGFTNVAWTTYTGEDVINIPVPQGVQPGNYKVTFSLTNGHETVDYDLTYQINLGSDMIRAIFSDVISIVDTCNGCFTDYQWYHNGEKIEGANLPYYQDPSGQLNGNYHLAVKMNGNQVYTCRQANFAIINPSDDVTALKASVKASPNPATDRVTLTVANTSSTSHSLRIINVMGMTIANTTFEGESVDINLSGYEHGTYTVIVDGMVTRVIKK